MTRNDEIYELRKSGMTLQAIGNRYGISRERVRQICYKKDKRTQRCSWFPVRNKDEARICTMLNRAGIETLDEFLALNLDDVLSIRGIGIDSCFMIRDLQRELRRKEGYVK